MGSSSLVDNMARHLAALLAVLAVAACLQTTLGYEFGCGPSHVHNACREDGSSQPGGIADDCCAFEGQGSCATGYVFYEGNHGCSNGAFGGVLVDTCCYPDGDVDHPEDNDDVEDHDDHHVGALVVLLVAGLATVGGVAACVLTGCCKQCCDSPTPSNAPAAAASAVGMQQITVAPASVTAAHGAAAQEASQPAVFVTVAPKTV